MALGRRSFLSLMSFVPPAAIAAEKMVAAEGGEVGISRKEVPLDQPAKFVAPHFVDKRDHALYDVLRIPAGTLVPKYWPFFSSPVGYNKPGTFEFKTFADTNMEMCGSLPAPGQHCFNRILFLFSPAMLPEDRNRLASSYYWEFQCGSRILARAPVARCAVLGHPKDLFKDFGGNRFPHRNSARVSDQFCMYMSEPIVIPPLAYMAMTFQGEPFVAAGDMEFFVLLDGKYDFAVQ